MNSPLDHSLLRLTLTDNNCDALDKLDYERLLEVLGN